MRRFSRFGLRFALAIAGCGLAQAREKWLYSQSDHFELLSSAAEWESRKMLVDLEQFRASFLATIHLHAARDPRVRGAKVLLPDYEKKLVFRPVTDLERDVALENLRYRLRHTADSEYKLLQLVEREPTSPRPYEVLAAIAMYDRETRMALDRWSKAGALGTTNAFVYLQLAKDVVRQILIGISLDYRIPETECAQLRGWLDRAIELSPDYWEAYETLAVVEAFAAKPRMSVLQTIQTMVKQLRDPQRALVSLAVVRWRINDLSTSEAILNLLEKRPTGASSEKVLAGKLHKRIIADRAKALATLPQTDPVPGAAVGDAGIAK